MIHHIVKKDMHNHVIITVEFLYFSLKKLWYINIVIIRDGSIKN
jgi:hypothetical protein